MTNFKLQVALDELERLRDTVKGYRDRNGSLPNQDTDAGRAVTGLAEFTDGLRKLDIDKLLKP